MQPLPTFAPDVTHVYAPCAATQLQSLLQTEVNLRIASASP